MISVLTKCFDQLLGLSVIAERLAHVNKLVHVPGRKYEAAAELKRIFAEPVLSNADGFGALAGFRVVATEKMEDVCFVQPHCLVGLALFVDQKWKADSGLLAKVPGVAHITKADSHDLCPFAANFLFVFAQLRNVLAAEDSAIMTQEDHHRR
jgi:hypothetical protein